jgi:hypothetical protein
MELKKITIDGQEIEIYVKEIVSANIWKWQLVLLDFEVEIQVMVGELI